MAWLPWSGALSETPSFDALRQSRETQHFALGGAVGASCVVFHAGKS